MMKRLHVAAVMFFLLMTAVAFAQDKKAGEKSSGKMNSIKKIAGEALAAKKPVFLYFHSETIPDSGEMLPVIKALADAKKAIVVDMEALELDDLRYGYGVEYVPTLILLKPEVGVAAKWVVDIPKKEVEDALSAKVQPIAVEKQIGAAIAKKKPQLYFFMAQWCGYCQRLGPQIEKFQQDFSDRVEVITIDVDRDNNGKLKDLYAVGGIPVVLIVDKSGVVVVRTGYPDGYDQYRMYFKALGVDMDKIAKK